MIASFESLDDYYHDALRLHGYMTSFRERSIRENARTCWKQPIELSSVTSRCVATKFYVLNKPHKYNRAYRANIKSLRFSNKVGLFRFDLKKLFLRI